MKKEKDAILLFHPNRTVACLSLCLCPINVKMAELMELNSNDLRESLWMVKDGHNIVEIHHF